ncbi:MAG TPA: c-type cytochrome [Rhizomicrobium sp.]|nr:c-type cytochrome [Rhizomicrobium sp.]
MESDLVPSKRLGFRAALMVVTTSLAMALISSAAHSATQSEILASCESCHGARGDSRMASTPRLNGQQAEFIVNRLKKFSKLTQKDPHAQIGMFKELAFENNAIREAIAQYFASQRPTDPKSGVRATEGRTIYENGIASENVIACDQCHGALGEGHGPVPRIAGQHAEYLNAQLRLFNVKFREHDLMNPNTKTMTRKTMEALASYLAND